MTLRPALVALLLLAAPPARAGSATYPVASVAACDGITDDTAAIRGLVASVPTGSVIEFPTNATCRITGGLLIDRPMSLIGLHSRLDRTDVYPLDGPHLGGAIIGITSSNVLVQGLILRGQVYGSAGARNTHGVWAIGDGTKKGARLTNITVRDVRAHRLRGRGVSLTHVNDFIVERCDVEDVGYAGVFVEDGRRGAIRGNQVVDIGDPEDCEGQVATCRNESSYGIALTGGNGVPMSEDVLILGNHVRENELWGGIVNHGGTRVLVADNEVLDTNFSYANTGATAPSSSTSFIENHGDILPTAVGGRYDLPPTGAWGEGLWFNAADAPAVGVRAIGNVLRNTGGGNTDAGLSAWALEYGTFTWNTIESDRTVPPPRSGVRLRSFGAGGVDHLQIAHNRLQARFHGVYADHASATWSTVAHNTLVEGSFGFLVTGGGHWSVHANHFGAASVAEVLGAYTSWGPPISYVSAPTSFTVATTAPSRVALEWSSGRSPHDAFYIEARRNGGPWRRVAYRPPNHSVWAFDAPTNPFWVPFEATRYDVDGLGPGYWQFRIRALWGAGVSAWSSVAGAFVF